MEGLHDIQTISPEARHRVVQQLRNNICGCGNNKRRGYGFCAQCTNSLPMDMRRVLGQIVSDNFVETYHNAEKLLHDHREKGMWRKAGTFNLQDIQRTWDRWGKAATTGGLLVAFTTMGAVFLTVLREKGRHNGDQAWTKKEERTA